MRRRLQIIVAAWLMVAGASGLGLHTSAKVLPGAPQIREIPGRAAWQPSVVRLDSSLVFTPLDEGNLLSRRLEQNTARSLSAHLAVSASRFYGIERYEMSKVQCALTGADAGLTLGLIAGALGMTAGLWDERTAWYLGGAAAALGTLWGASMADEPKFRVRIRWDDSDRRP